MPFQDNIDPLQDNIDREAQSTEGAVVRSTAEWEAALEEAHLDGLTLSWLYNGRDPVTGRDLGARIVYYDGGYSGGEINLPSGGLICGSVSSVIAPLFVLAPEAVAEAVRLRRALEALRDHARDIRGHDTTADDITRILNGETDE